MKKNKQIDFRKFRIKKIINLPDTLTFLNLLSGMASIYFAVEKKFVLASVMLFTAVIMDYLDGKAATLLHQKTEFGKQIDSLADLVSFGVSPGIFGFFYYKSQIPTTSPFLLLAIAIFIICGLVRLAQYNVINYQAAFIGMPITINGLLFPLIYFVSLPAILLPYLYIISGILMLSSIKVKRVP